MILLLVLMLVLMLSRKNNLQLRGPAGLAVKPLDLHLVNVGSIPTGPMHGEVRLYPHPGDVLESI